MRIKKSFTIMGVPYDVRYKWGLLCDDGNLVDGLCDTKKKEIWICAALKGYDKDFALLHEIVHAICHEAAISGNRVAGGITELQEEQICEAIPQEFLKLFRIAFKTRKDK